MKKEASVFLAAAFLVLIGINRMSDPAHGSGIGDPEGDGQEVRRFSTRQGCLVEKSRPKVSWQI
jgi:hypothetical protein